MNGKGGNISATVEIYDAKGRQYSNTAMIVANWASSDDDVQSIKNGTSQHCWNNLSTLASGPCLVHLPSFVSGTPFSQPQVITSTGVAVFRLRELSGLWVPKYIVFCIGANPPTCVVKPIPTAIRWRVLGCESGCFWDFDAEVTSFPSATGHVTPMTFSVDTAVQSWSYGFPSYPRCVNVEFGIEVPCNYRDTIPKTIVFEYVHSYRTRARMETETTIVVTFPASAPEGAYRIILVVPGSVYEVGTVFVGQSSCVLAPVGDITAPPSLMIGESLRMSVHVQCGNAPAIGAVVVATVDADTSDCEATECGVLQAEGARAVTDLNGTANFYLIPAAIMPNQTMWLNFEVPVFDPLRAPVEASHQLGNSTSSLDEELIDRADRLFALATNRVRSHEPSLRIGPIRIANDVVGVEITVEPEMKCTLESEKSSSSDSDGSDEAEEQECEFFPLSLCPRFWGKSNGPFLTSLSLCCCMKRVTNGTQSTRSFLTASTAGREFSQTRTALPSSTI